MDRIVEIELENFSVEEAIPLFLKLRCEIRPRFWLEKKAESGYIEDPVGPPPSLQDQSLQRR